MVDADIDEFLEIWRGALEVYGKSPSDSAVAITFKTLQRYDLADVKAGLVAHLADPQAGKFSPKPADVIAQIEQAVALTDNRPTADEAWAIALNSFDEAATVVLNDEIAGALEAAREIYLDGDKTGARMAFRARYDQLLNAARQQRKPVRWWPSLGHDQSARDAALEQAVIAGYLPLQQVSGLLSGPIVLDDNPALGMAKAKLKLVKHDS